MTIEKVGPRLADEIRRLLEERGISVHEAARQARIGYAALRYWLEQNAFPPHGIRSLAPVLDLDPSIVALEKRFEFTRTRARRTLNVERDVALGWEGERAVPDPDCTLTEALAAIEEHPRLLDLSRRSWFVRVFERVFSSLGADDIYVCSYLDEPPFEMARIGLRELAPAIAGAVDRGATICYLSPTLAVDGDDGDDAIDAGAAGCFVPAKITVERQFQGFRATLGRQLERIGRPASLERVHCVMHSIGMFTMPGTVHSLFLSRGDDEPVASGICRSAVRRGDGNCHLVSALSEAGTNHYLEHVCGVLRHGGHEALALRVELLEAAEL